jgi:hypothetical protein
MGRLLEASNHLMMYSVLMGIYDVQGRKPL